MGSEECHTVLKCTTKRFWADSGKDTKAASAIELLRGLGIEISETAYPQDWHSVQQHARHRTRVKRKLMKGL